ncbi:MAG: amidohydrolase [Clostridia bacterium]|nr:amidohydrolase [Clostridia bacterium]
MARLWFNVFIQTGGLKCVTEKERCFAYLDGRLADFAALSDQVWEYAETAFHEDKSAEVLAAALEAEGFTVERGVAGISTAFTATWGSGKPVIGFLGEYDALSGLSQVGGETQHNPIQAGAPGHGCGHNLLGAGSLAAAVATRRAMIEGRRSGTLIYFGCPAEEGGSGKTFMAREGLFDSLDAALAWHPSANCSVSTEESLANYQVLYRFYGKAAHAAGDPYRGRSALDAVELMNTGVQYLREHIPTTARVHYAITDTGGYSPNVVQAYASVLYLMRMPKVEELPDLYARVNDIAKGAALMTGTQVEIDFIKACSNRVNNWPMNRLVQLNMELVGAVKATEEEKAFGRALRKSYAEDDIEPYNEEIAPLVEVNGIGSGSTDIGDVSKVCPTGYFYMASKPVGTPGHSWQTNTCGKTSFAHRSLGAAAKVMSATALDLIDHPELLEEMWRAHREEQPPYVCPIPKDVKPRALTNLR